MAASGAPMLALMGTSAIGSIGTAYAQSRALKATGAYQGALADTNASMAALAGQQTIQAGDIAAGRKNLETRENVGTELARQGASGVDVGSGSAALVRGGTNLIGKTDELTIRNNAARAAFGYKVQGIQDTFAGRFARMTAATEAQQSLLTGGLQAISGPLTIGANYLRYSRYIGGGSGGSIPISYVNQDK